MLIRPMTADDCEYVARLCAQLGYPSTPAQIAQRFERIAGHQEHGVFVAEVDGGEVVGLVHVHGRYLLEQDAFAEIGGLVVDSRYRRRNVGSALLRQAEQWASAAGFGNLRVRSNTLRPEAHGFYPACGYILVKSQHVYSKSL